MFQLKSIRLFAIGMSAIVAQGALALADDKPAAKPEATRKATRGSEGEKARRDPEALLARRDKNKDGALELKEFLGKQNPDDPQAVARFEKRDRNGDGKITKAELTSGREAKAAKQAKKAKKASKAAKKAKKAAKPA